jgi:TRAP-type C4-dicarboxylate transport system substrate-binding protein
VNAQTVTLKFSQFLGPKSFFQVDVLEPWAKEIEARTGGRIKVETFDGTTPLGGVADQASNVKSGKSDIALGLRGAEGGKFPGSSLIELPFLVPDAARGSKALWDLYKDGTLAREYADYKVLALFVHNPGLVHTKDKPVRLPGDMKGLRLRSPNNTVSEALRTIGAEPLVLQVNEIPPAFEAGRLDGIVTNWGNPISRFNDYVKHHTELMFYTSAFFILMNKERYEGLPPDLRAAIDETTGDIWVAKFGDYWNKWDAPVRGGANAPGHEIIVPTASEMSAWRGALAPVTDKYVGTLEANGFTNARQALEKLTTALR